MKTITLPRDVSADVDTAYISQELELDGRRVREENQRDRSFRDRSDYLDRHPWLFREAAQ